MRTRRGTQVRVLGFGAGEIGAENTSFATVDRIIGQALDSGLNAIDTAPLIFRQRRKNEKIARDLSGRQGIEDFSPMTWKCATVGFTEAERRYAQ